MSRKGVFPSCGGGERERWKWRWRKRRRRRRLKTWKGSFALI